MNEITAGHNHKAGDQRKKGNKEKNDLFTSHIVRSG
jgi:hypothetical protein